MCAFKRTGYTTNHEIVFTGEYDNIGNILVSTKRGYIISCEMNINGFIINQTNLNRCVLDSYFLRKSGTFIIKVISTLDEDLIEIESQPCLTGPNNNFEVILKNYQYTISRGFDDLYSVRARSDGEFLISCTLTIANNESADMIQTIEGTKECIFNDGFFGVSGIYTLDITSDTKSGIIYLRQINTVSLIVSAIMSFLILLIVTIVFICQCISAKKN